MDLHLLKTLGEIAGVAGVSLGIVLLLFRDILKKIVPSGLTKRQWFRVIMTFLVLVWSLGVLGVAAWVYAETYRTEHPKRYAEWSPDQLTEVSGGSSELGPDGENIDISYDYYLEQPFYKVVADAEHNFGVTIDYRDLPSLTDATVSPGTIAGSDASEFIANIQTKLKNSNVRYQVRKTAKKSYHLSPK